MSSQVQVWFRISEINQRKQEQWSLLPCLSLTLCTIHVFKSGYRNLLLLVNSELAGKKIWNKILDRRQMEMGKMTVYNSSKTSTGIEILLRGFPSQSFCYHSMYNIADFKSKRKIWITFISNQYVIKQKLIAFT